MAAGVWTLTVNTPQGAVPSTLKLDQSGAGLSGEITTTFGTVPINNGSLRGNEIKFDFPLNMQGQQSSVTCTGKIEGNAISGTMHAMGQAFEFSGARRPN